MLWLSRCRPPGFDPAHAGWTNSERRSRRRTARAFTDKVTTNGTRATVHYRFHIVVPEVDGGSKAKTWPLTTGTSRAKTFTIVG